MRTQYKDEGVPPESWFRMDTTTYLSHNSWTLVMGLELEPYQSYFKEITENLENFHTVVSDRLLALSSLNNDSASANFRRSILPILQQEIDNFSAELDTLRHIHGELKISLGPNTNRKVTRNKRALLGFLQPLLQSVFGLSSVDDVRNLKTNMNTMRLKYDRLSFLMGNTIAILNTTHAQVGENRMILNKLSESVTSTQIALNDIVSKIQLEMRDEFDFGHFVDSMVSMFNLASSSIHRISYNLQTLKNDLALARNGNLSPTLISSRQLKELLKTIKRKLQVPYTLPYPIKEVAQYYHNFPVIMVSNGNSISLALVIPLKEAGKPFNLYQIHNLPSSSGGMLYYWQPESNFLAVSHDETSYAILSAEEFNLCRSGICNIKSPLYKMQDTPSCATSLLYTHVEVMRRYCQVRREERPRQVTATYIVDTYWLIISDLKWQLDIICESFAQRMQTNVTHVQIADTIFILDLDPNCKATGRYFTISAKHSEVLRPSLTLENKIRMIKFPVLNMSSFKHVSDTYHVPVSRIQRLTPDDIGGEVNRLTDELTDDDWDETWENLSVSSHWSSWLLLGTAVVVGLCVLGAGFVMCRWKVTSGQKLLSICLGSTVTDERTDARSTAPTHGSTSIEMMSLDSSSHIPTSTSDITTHSVINTEF